MPQIKVGTIQESFLINPYQWIRPQWSITTAKTVFEGLKAYVSEDDHVLLFRPEKIWNA